MRLIDADALNLEYEVDMADDWKTAHEIANIVKYAPTIDAVPREKYERMKENAEILSKACDEKEYVIRCKDCKHWDGEERNGFYYFETCSLTDSDRQCDDYCPYGERGEADDNTGSD